MTTHPFLLQAMAQSALDLACSPDDFTKSENVVVESKKTEGAHVYFEQPFLCNVTSYGKNAVASVKTGYHEKVKAFLDAFPTAHLFETPAIYALNEIFREEDSRVCFLAEFFLPDPEKLSPLPTDFEIKRIEQKDFLPLYLPEWSNALCKDRKELDRVGFGAFDEKGNLIGFAACSEDCASMWQIGVDVLPPFRGRGIASALTSRLALEILRRGKIPFYCASWCNLASVRNALRSGFFPAWTEMTVKSNQTVSSFLPESFR